jgi:hypothetical protein
VTSTAARLLVGVAAIVLVPAHGTTVAMAAPAAANRGVPADRTAERPATGEPAVAPAEPPPGIEGDYAAFKEMLRIEYGLQYSLDVSLVPQWTAAKGGDAVGNFIYAPTISWTPFADSWTGSGTFVFSYQQNRFWTRSDTNALLARVGFLSAPSDWFGNLSGVAQLTYSHTLPDAWSWLSATVGQYSFALYDQAQYAGGSPTNFSNYALAQNGTQAYVSADLGAFAQAATPDREWALAGGFQGATNLSGEGISPRGIETGRLAYFAAAQYAPSGWGGSYGLLWYLQPAVPDQPSNSHGISFSAAQRIAAKWAAILRVNTASGFASPIATSVAWGVIEDDPFGRGRPDQIGFGFAWNQTNIKAVGQPARSAELVAEIYASYALFDGLKVGPDLQLYNHPALAPGSGAAAVFTLRGTASF